MNVKELRERTGLSQKDFGSRLGLTSQSITKFEAGGNVTETVRRLIRYEFSQFLPEGEGLGVGANDEALKRLGAENEKLQQRVEDLERDKEDLKKDKEMLQLHIETLTSQSSTNKGKIA